jgi:2-polyprenyl-3-methyl-5-hydroxy-6-metoxy-1,4-benzoquinol methylase
MDLLFEYRNCPGCGQNDFEVLFESNMKSSDSQKGIETVYMLPEHKHGRHVKCKNCHLIYVNPIEKASKINGDYSKMGNPDAPIIRESRLRAAKSQLGLIKNYKNGTTLLDVGCGEGFFLFNASKAGYTAKGIDISQDAAEYARREFGLNVEAKPFKELQFPENYFDVVTLWQVLEHVPYPLTILKEVHRVLKPGGMLAVSTPDVGGILARIFRTKWWNISRLHINQFTSKTLKRMLENAGFENVFPASYWECIDLSMLLTIMLKYVKVYKQSKALRYHGSALAKIMGKVKFIYPAKLDNCVMIGFKQGYEKSLSIARD